MTCISLSWIYMALLDDLQCMPNGTRVTAFGNASQIWMSSGLAWILPGETGGNVVFQYFLRSLPVFQCISSHYISGTAVPVRMLILLKCVSACFFNVVNIWDVGWRSWSFINILRRYLSHCLYCDSSLQNVAGSV